MWVLSVVDMSTTESTHNQWKETHPVTFSPVVVKQDFWHNTSLRSLFRKVLYALTHVGGQLESSELKRFLETITDKNRETLLPCIEIKNGEYQTWFQRKLSAIDSDQWVATRYFTAQTTSSSTLLPPMSSIDMPFVDGAGEKEWTLMRAALVFHPDGHNLLKILISKYIKSILKDESLQPVLSNQSDAVHPF